MREARSPHDACYEGCSSRPAKWKSLAEQGWGRGGPWCESNRALGVLLLACDKKKKKIDGL